MKRCVLLVFGLLMTALPGIAQKDVEAIIAKASEIQRSGNFAEAAAELNKALAIEPKSTRLLFAQAHYHELARNSAAALENVERALKLEPANEETVIEAIRRLYKPGTPGRCERALAVTNSFLVNHPRSDKAYSWLFFTKQCLQDDAGALAAINKAVDLNPTYPLYHANRANLVSRMGNNKLAQDLLKKLIEVLDSQLDDTKDQNARAAIQREIGTAFSQLAVVYERTGDKTFAIEALTSGMRYHHEPLLQHRARAYSRFGMHKEAIADIDRLIAEKESETAQLKNAPTNVLPNASLYRERGDIFFNAGEYQKALAIYEELLRRDPINKSTYQRLIDRVNQSIEKPK